MAYWRLVLGFGAAIGLLLLPLQLAHLAGLPPRSLDAYVALVGLLFLVAGLALGARTAARRHDDARPPQPAAATDPAQPAAPAGPLTAREIQMLRALAEGCSNEEIARRHFVSVNTVKTHLKQIHGKLGVHRRGQAVARARQLGLLEDLADEKSPVRAMAQETADA